MPDEHDSQLDQIAEEIVAQCRAGQSPDLDLFCRRHPSLAADIADLFPALIRLEQARPTGHGPVFNAALRLASANAGPLGDYRIVREIGRGGMGIVYEAVQESLHRPVALKVLSPGRVSDRRYVERFEREAHAAARLHHTNIVPVLGVGEDQQLHYLVMQLIDGFALDEVLTAILGATGGCPTQSRDSPRTLSGIAAGLLRGSIPLASELTQAPQARSTDAHSHLAASARAETAPKLSAAQEVSQDFVPQGGKLDSARSPYWHSVARIGLQAADALNYAANQGVVHRDIKPSNLLLDAQGTVWVADFGLAKMADSAELTMTGELIGTLRYLPPERLHGESDVRGDIYGLGATLYELICLRPPFAEDGQAVLLRQIVETEPLRPRSINPAIPRDLETIVVKAMAKNPADRYATPEELAGDLRCFLEDLPITARRTSSVERLWRWCRRQPAVAIPTAATALLLIVVALGSVAAAVWLRHETEVARNAEQRARDTEQDRRQELFRAHLAGVRASAASGKLGQRLKGLQGIQQALAVIPAPEQSQAQRSDSLEAAIPCLALADAREVRRITGLTGWREELDVDSAFESFLQPSEQGSGTVVAAIENPAHRLSYLGDRQEVSRFRCLRRFSPGGRWLAEIAGRSQSDDLQHIRVWERDSRRLALDLLPDVPGNYLEFHPDDRHVLIAASDSVLRLVDLETGKAIRESPPRFRKAVVSFDPTGKSLAVGSRQGTAVEILDPLTWQTIDVTTEPGRITSAAWNPRADYLLVGGENGRLYLRWNRSGRFLGDAHQAPVDALQFSADGRLLASSAAGVTRIRRMDGDQALVDVPGTVLRFSPDGRKLAVVENSDLVIYSLVMTEAFRQIRNVAETATFSPDGQCLAIAGMNGVQLFSTDAWTKIADLGLDHCGPVVFDRAHGSLVTFGIFSHACRWPLVVGPSLRVGPPSPILSARIPSLNDVPMRPQHAGRHAASSDDGRLVLADFRHGRVMLADSPQEPPRKFADFLNVARVAISPDARWVAGASVYSGTVRVWNAEDHSLALELPDEMAVAFSPDGHWFAARSQAAVRCFRVGQWKQEHRIELEGSRESYFFPLAFQPHGRLLAIAGPQEQVYLYDRESGRLVTRLLYRTVGNCSALSFSPDGSRLVAVHAQVAVAIWDLRCLQRELVEMGLAVERNLLISATNTSPQPPGPNSIVVDRGTLPANGWYKWWQKLAAREADEKNWAGAIHAINVALDQCAVDDASARATLSTDRGNYHLNNRDPSAARDDWQHAVNLDPAAVSAARSLARLHLLGEEAIRDVRRVEPLLTLLKNTGATDASIPIFQALAKIRQGQFAEARTLLAAVPNSDASPYAAYSLALAHHGLSDTSLASAALKRAMILQQEQAPSLTSLEREELDRLRFEVEQRLDLQTSK